MTRLEAYTWGCQVLKKISPSARLDVEVLLLFILKISSEELTIRPQIKLTTKQKQKFTKLILTRVKGVPIAYLTGSKEFYGLNFKVSPKVLIPRPTTEILVEQILEFSKNKYKNPTILEIGTGSGIIAITLAKLLPTATITASDFSATALKVAKINAKANQVKIKFLKSNLLSNLTSKSCPNIICANLPYLDKNLKISNWQKLQLSFEPSAALWAKDKGLALYFKMFKQIKQKKWLPDLIIIEINPGQANILKKFCQQLFPDYQIKKITDLTGYTRFLEITKTTH